MTILDKTKPAWLDGINTDLTDDDFCHIWEPDDPTRAICGAKPESDEECCDPPRFPNCGRPQCNTCNRIAKERGYGI